MKWSDDLAARCSQLLSINRTLFDAGHLEAAYHALKAALYCAFDCGDLLTIHQVRAVAAAEHRRLSEQARATRANPTTSLAESRRLASLGGLYAIAVRQASLKALNLDPSGADTSEFGA